MPRHSVHAQNRSPPQKRPTSPRRRISRTRTRVSQRARPRTSTRRSPTSNRTRARAARRWCRERGSRPPAAMPSTRRLRATAACRRWPRHAAAEPSVCRGSVLHAWACTSLRRTSTGTWSASRLGVRASIEKAGDGERESNGAPRGDERTTEMRSVPDLIRMSRLPAGAAARTSRAPPPGAS